MNEHVGGFSASLLSYMSSIVSGSVILICYLIAVYNGHVHPWLPMISSCGVKSPEKYIFTIGLTISSMLLFLNSLLFYFYLNTKSLDGRKDTDKLALLFSFISSIGLMVLATANAVDDTSIHIPAAFVFFTFHLFFMIYSTLRLYIHSNYRRIISTRSLMIKTIIIIVSVIDIVISAILIAIYRYEEHLLLVAITEWIAVFLISLFTLSFVLEFGHNEYVGAFLLEPYYCQKNYYLIDRQVSSSNRPKNKAKWYF